MKIPTIDGMKAKIDLEATLASQNAWGMSEAQLYNLFKSVAEECVEYCIKHQLAILNGGQS